MKILLTVSLLCFAIFCSKFLFHWKNPKIKEWLLFKRIKKRYIFSTHRHYSAILDYTVFQNTHIPKKDSSKTLLFNQTIKSDFIILHGNTYKIFIFFIKISSGLCYLLYVLLGPQ